MAGTVLGGRQAYITNTTRDPYHYHKIGALGGQKGTTGGFWARRDIARAAGAIAGTISRRGQDYMSHSRLDPKKLDKAYKHLLKIQQMAQAKRELARQAGLLV